MIALHDAIEDHPKFVGLSDDCFGLWVRGIGYCRRELTDGFIPEAAAVRRCRGKRPPAAQFAELCGPPAGAPTKAPLWSRVLGGFQVHDYLDWNPSAEEVEAKRKEKRAAASLGGKRSGESRRTKAEAESKHSASLSVGSQFVPSSSNASPAGEPSGSGSVSDQIFSETVVLPQPPETGPRNTTPVERNGSLESSTTLRNPGDHQNGHEAAILEALRSHEVIASWADQSFAQTLEGRRATSATKLEDVVRAIGEAAADTPAGELAHLTQKRVRVYCDNAKVRARAKGPAPKWVNDRVQHDPPGRQGWKTATPITGARERDLTPEELDQAEKIL